MIIVGAEKLRDTPFDAVVVDEVTIVSRYGKIRELERMAHVVASLEPSLRRQVAGLWCDSKAESCYTVDLRSADAAREIGEALSRLFCAQTGGHNGITVHLGGIDEPIVYELDPEWIEEGWPT